MLPLPCTFGIQSRGVDNGWVSPFGSVLSVAAFRIAVHPNMALARAMARFARDAQFTHPGFVHLVEGRGSRLSAGAVAADTKLVPDGNVILNLGILEKGGTTRHPLLGFLEPVEREFDLLISHAGGKPVGLHVVGTCQ